MPGAPLLLRTATPLCLGVRYVFARTPGRTYREPIVPPRTPSTVKMMKGSGVNGWESRTISYVPRTSCASLPGKPDQAQRKAGVQRIPASRVSKLQRGAVPVLVTAICAAPYDQRGAVVDVTPGEIQAEPGVGVIHAGQGLRDHPLLVVGVVAV